MGPTHFPEAPLEKMQQRVDRKEIPLITHYIEAYRNYNYNENGLDFETWSVLERNLPVKLESSPDTPPSELIFDSVLHIHVTEWLMITGYGKKLNTKVNRLIYEDDYGDIIYDDALSEVMNFTERKFDELRDYVTSKTPSPIYSIAGRGCIRWKVLNYYPSTGEGKNEAINEALSAILVCRAYCESSNYELELNGFETTNPYEYEIKVATKLKSLGWSARTTSGSGDQGADVIAEMKEVVFVIQCKLYSGPVGNKAVQEVLAAKGYYDANVAAVVTNQSYTKSAKKLAYKLGVLLLHHDELESACEELMHF